MKVRLAVALRMFAGASYIDVAVLYGIAKESVFHIMWEVVDAINNTPTVGPFFFPQTVEECTRQAREWEVGACVFVANPPGVLSCCGGNAEGLSRVPPPHECTVFVAREGLYLTEWAHRVGAFVESEAIPLFCLHRCNPVQNATTQQQNSGCCEHPGSPAVVQMLPHHRPDIVRTWCVPIPQVGKVCKNLRAGSAIDS